MPRLIVIDFRHGSPHDISEDCFAKVWLLMTQGRTCHFVVQAQVRPYKKWRFLIRARVILHNAPCAVDLLAMVYPNQGDNRFTRFRLMPVLMKRLPPFFLHPDVLSIYIPSFTTTSLAD